MVSIDECHQLQPAAWKQEQSLRLLKAGWEVLLQEKTRKLYRAAARAGQGLS